MTTTKYPFALWVRADDSKHSLRICTIGETASALLMDKFGACAFWDVPSAMDDEIAHLTMLPPDAVDLARGVIESGTPVEILMDRLIELGVPGAAEVAGVRA